MRAIAWIGICMAATAAAPVAAQQASVRFVVPAWAFPTAPAPTPASAPIPAFVPDTVILHHVPGSTRTFTVRHVVDRFDIPDWFPESHPPMPAPVQFGSRPAGWACGFCHLPDGQGRPENATLAGLPAAYIRAQVAAFRDSTRLSANPVASTNSMHLVARAVSERDIALAADYFASLALRRRNRVREVSQVPRTRIAGNLYAYDGEGTEPIAGRLIEVPETLERHELRDPGVEYITYVPRGSIERGRRLAADGPAGVATACATCHGPQLLGVALVPPIAGRSPSYILRQLMNIRTGARHDSASVAMRPVVERLSVDDMVALAAYVGSLAPKR